MRYELDLINELCGELGLRTRRPSPDTLAIDVEPDVALVFVNAERDDDCLIGFEGTPWHYHDDLLCSDRHGNYIRLGYLDVVSGLADGTVLLCERWVHGTLEDRGLVHRDYVDEFRHMDANEEIRVRPAIPSANRVSPATDP